MGWGGSESQGRDKSVAEPHWGVEDRCHREKDTRLDHLQKRNDELSALLEKAKGDAVAEFKAFKQFTDMLDCNYVAGFEDFRMDATKKFPEIDFNSIKLNLSGAAMSSLLQTSSEDINVEDDASTQPPKDAFNTDAPPA